jgi:hypothetical protein
MAIKSRKKTILPFRLRVSLDRPFYLTLCITASGILDQFLRYWSRR